MHGIQASDTDTWQTINQMWKTGIPVWRNATTGTSHQHQAGLIGSKFGSRESRFTRASSPTWMKVGHAGRSTNSAFVTQR